MELNEASLTPPGFYYKNLRTPSMFTMSAKQVRVSSSNSSCSFRHECWLGMVGAFEPSLMPDCREALRRCINLRSFTWIDDGHDTSNDADLLAYLSILQSLPFLSSLTIRTSSGISEEVWSILTELTGLLRVSIWCLHGKPRVLQGWSEKLGGTLTHLELGVSGLSRQHPYCTS